MAVYERCRALLAAGRGLPDEAERWAAEALARAEATGIGWDRLEALRARGIGALLAHEPARAAESLRAVWEHMQREGVDEPGVFPVAPDLVEALVELGELDEARAVTDRLRELAEEHDIRGGSRPRSAARRSSGSPPARTRERRGGARGRGRRYGALGLRFDRARSLLSLGRAQRRLRKWGAARDVARAGRGRVRRARLARLGASRRAPSAPASAAGGRRRAAS